MKIEFSWHIFEKVSNIKVHQNSSGGSRGVPRGRTDMTKVIVAFSNFANARKKKRYSRFQSSFKIESQAWKEGFITRGLVWLLCIIYEHRGWQHQRITELSSCPLWFQDGRPHAMNFIVGTFYHKRHWSARKCVSKCFTWDACYWNLGPILE